jgi:hypothetical protein
MAGVAVFSSVVWSLIAEIVGGSLTSLTVSTKSVEAVAVPSLTVSVMVVVPLTPATGVSVTVRFAPLPPKRMFPSGTSAVLLETPVTVNVPTALSLSPTVNAIAPVGVLSGVDWSLIAEMVGASFTASTVRVKLVEVSSVPSLTVMVIMEVPVTPGAGVTVTVRLAPLPPKLMLATGTKVVLLEPALTVRLPGAVSASPTVKAIAGVAVFSEVDWSAMAEIVGAVFAAVTVRTKSVDALSVPSSTVTVIVVVPLAAGAGVSVMVLLGPPPPNEIFAFGTTAGLLELPVTVRLPGAVSASPMVNAIAPVGVSWAVD